MHRAIGHAALRAARGLLLRGVAIETIRDLVEILGAMSFGVDRKTAAEFSFFLALPTLTGATILQLFKHRDAITTNDLSLIAVGSLVSFVVAWAVIKAFLAVVTRYGFAPFAWYRIIAGVAALIWLGMR